MPEAATDPQGEERVSRPPILDRRKGGKGGFAPATVGPVQGSSPLTADRRAVGHGSPMMIIGPALIWVFVFMPLLTSLPRLLVLSAWPDR